MPQLFNQLELLIQEEARLQREPNGSENTAGETLSSVQRSIQTLKKQIHITRIYG